MTKQSIHGGWNRRMTFILAAAGSAVGLGNLWKFPYITGEYGGGAFVLVYLFSIALVGVPLFIAESLIGRQTREAPIRALASLAQASGRGRGWASIGWLGAVNGLLILSFYSVIAGWSLDYLLGMAKGAFSGASAEQVEATFDGLLGSVPRLVLWHSLFMMAVVWTIARGVQKGIGDAIQLMMPALFILLLVLLVYGAIEGDLPAALGFMFSVDFSKLSLDAWVVALGHSFYTLSLGMAVIMAYGAYMPAGVSLVRTAGIVALTDTLVALLAGLAIFALVFGNGLDASAGPGLMFVSLPMAFAQMPFGSLFGAAFFLLVAFAALSSAISLVEPIVAFWVEKTGIARTKATVILCAFAWALGMATVLSFNHWSSDTLFHAWFGKTAFDSFDFLSTNLLLPLGGVLTALFAGWFVLPQLLKDQYREGGTLTGYPLWLFALRVISPAGVSLVLLTGLGVNLWVSALVAAVVVLGAGVLSSNLTLKTREA